MNKKTAFAKWMRDYRSKQGIINPYYQMPLTEKVVKDAFTAGIKWAEDEQVRKLDEAYKKELGIVHYSASIMDIPELINNGESVTSYAGRVTCPNCINWMENFA